MGPGSHFVRPRFKNLGATHDWSGVQRGQPALPREETSRPRAHTLRQLGIRPMERRSFGKTGLQVSVLGFGGAEIGFDDGVDAARVAEVLHPAIDAGLNV